MKLNSWTCVVHFDQLSGTARTRKLLELLFSAVFKLFCSFFTFFSDFTPEINKNVWKWTKKRVFVYSSKLVDMQKLVDSLTGYLEIVFFQLIFYKLVKIHNKRELMNLKYIAVLATAVAKTA